MWLILVGEMSVPEGCKEVVVHLFCKEYMKLDLLELRIPESEAKNMKKISTTRTSDFDTLKDLLNENGRKIARR